MKNYKENKSYELPDHIYDNHETIPTIKTAVNAVEVTMLQYGGGCGGVAWDTVWEKHKSFVEELLTELFNKAGGHVTYHDIASLYLPYNEYTHLDNKMEVPEAYLELHSYMDEIADENEELNWDCWGEIMICKSLYKI